MNGQIDHWERLSSHPPDASVIDPNDRRGHKNRYITALRNEAIITRLQAVVAGQPILDFGCGTGSLSAALAAAGHTVLGLDISPGLLARTGERGLGPAHLFVRFDGLQLPLATGSVPAAATYVVLNHIIADDDLRQVLGEIHRVLAPGGRLVAVEQVRRRARIDPSAWQHRRTIAGFERLFEDAGLRRVSCDLVRYGRLPTTYAVKFGLLPSRLWPGLRAIERALGRTVGVLPWDYSDVCFVLEKP